MALIVAVTFRIYKFSLAAGMDTMTWGKAIATALVFIGVSLVNFAPGRRS